MRKKIKLLNRIFCIFMYFLSFMTVLSLVFNLIYLTPIYDIILNKHPLTYTIILFSIIYLRRSVRDTLCRQSNTYTVYMPEVRSPPPDRPDGDTEDS